MCRLGPGHVEPQVAITGGAADKFAAENAEEGANGTDNVDDEGGWEVGAAAALGGLGLGAESAEEDADGTDNVDDEGAGWEVGAALGGLAAESAEEGADGTDNVDNELEGTGWEVGAAAALGGLGLEAEIGGGGSRTVVADVAGPAKSDLDAVEMSLASTSMGSLQLSLLEFVMAKVLLAFFDSLGIMLSIFHFPWVVLEFVIEGWRPRI